MTMLGHLLLREGKLDQAMEWFNRSLAYMQQMEHVYKESFVALTYVGVGTIFLERAEYQKAIEQFTKACDLMKLYPKALGIGFHFIKAKLGLAKAYMKSEFSNESTESLKEAEKLFRAKQELDFHWAWDCGDALTEFEFAIYFAMAGKQDQSREWLRRAREHGFADSRRIDSLQLQQ